MAIFLIPSMVLGLPSMADHLSAVSDKIDGAFYRSGAIQAAALDVSKIFNRVWHAGFLSNLTSFGI